MSVLVRVGVDICIQLSTVSSCLAGQVNNNNNTVSNEPERGERREKRTMNLVATALPCSAKPPEQRRSDQKLFIMFILWTSLSLNIDCI